MKRYNLTPAAQRGIQAIARYTRKQWGVGQRDRYIADIKARIEWLASNPRLGMSRPELFHDIFCYPEGEHLIFYRVFPDFIDVIGLPNMQQDILAHFGFREETP